MTAAEASWSAAPCRRFGFVSCFPARHPHRRATGPRRREGIGPRCAGRRNSAGRSPARRRPAAILRHPGESGAGPGAVPNWSPAHQDGVPDSGRLPPWPPCLCVFNSSMADFRNRCADSDHPGPSRLCRSVVAPMIAFVKPSILPGLGRANETRRHRGHGETQSSIPRVAPKLLEGGGCDIMAIRGGARRWSDSDPSA